METERYRDVIRNPFHCIGMICRGEQVESFAWMLRVDDPAEWITVIGGAVAAINAAAPMQMASHQGERERLTEQLAKLDMKVVELMTEKEDPALIEG